MPYTVKTTYDDGYVVEILDNDTEPCESWLLFPAENLWPEYLRGFLYIIAIAYFFVGVAIASDIFMSSIEVITSKRRTVVKWDPVQKEKVEVEVLLWNETVANLTLMALGSSAPEILLATIEGVIGLSHNHNVHDSLGSFTILGSAAFNLLIITGICIVSVPKPDSKRVREFGVFVMTSAWSIWAYVWMLLVVKYISPGIITPLEAWITLGFMPLFVFLAYCQDSGWWLRSKKVGSGEVDDKEDKLGHIENLLPQVENRNVGDACHEADNVPTKADMLIAHATHPGYISLRNTMYGSWFIQAVIYVFKRHAHKEDILSLLTLVNRLVARGRTEDIVQASVFRSSLLKKLYFFPGVPAPDS